MFFLMTQKIILFLAQTYIIMLDYALWARGRPWDVQIRVHLNVGASEMKSKSSLKWTSQNGIYKNNHN